MYEDVNAPRRLALVSVSARKTLLLAKTLPRSGTTSSLESFVDGIAAATMSGKKATEKISEIDAHINKQYDIVRRLGKGVIKRYPPRLF